MAPLLLLIFGQGKLGIAVIAAIVVLFPALVNIVLGLAISVAGRARPGPRQRRLLGRPRCGRCGSRPRCRSSSRRRGSRCPGAIVGPMLAEWLVGFDGMGGMLSGYKGQGNYGGVWTIVALSVLVSIVLYELMTILETALLARWGPEAGVSR